MKFQKQLSTAQVTTMSPKGHLNTLTLGLAGASILLSAWMSTAEAVVFFKDGFERTTIGDGGFQNKLGPTWMTVKNTAVWDSTNNIDIIGNGFEGFNAYSGNNRVELDSTQNSAMSTKVNLENGKTYVLNFQYRSRPITVTAVKNNCFLFICWPTTTTTTNYVGGGLRAAVESPSYTTGYFYVGDVPNWTKASNRFTYWGTTGEATIRFEATGLSDAQGTQLDEVTLETDIPGSTGINLEAESLIGIKPPHVPGLTSKDERRSDIITPVVVNKDAAIALGKALFWDMAVGSDHMACASCHFDAGADMRFKNEFDPGLTHLVASGKTFENTKTGNKSGPNYTVKLADFPFDPNNDDIFGSSGTFSGDYKSSPSDQDPDACNRSVNSIFHVNGVGTRNVEPRNTPTVINAAYNHRNFWDGRANNEFNGASPFGRRDTAAGVYISKATGTVKAPLRLRNASLASQAVGPVGSDLEMACRARQFADVGRKLLPRVPLRSQTVASDDSVLSKIPAGSTYASLVKAAFAPEYWNGNCGSNCGTPGAGVSPATPYNQMEANFSMYFGLSVQMYMETLVSDDSKFDRWKSGKAVASAEESRGQSIFNGKGKCSSCHNGPTMTSAAILQKDTNVIQAMLMKNARKAVYDEGFYNTSVVPTAYDIGNGGVDPWNNPLSFAVQYLTGKFVDKFYFDSCTFEDLSPDLCSSNDSAAARSTYYAAVEGAFKTSNLRNIDLTGPYMHNGSLATLEQVVDFYNRGGNFDNRDKHPDILPLGLSTQEKADLVAFMKALTDDRVRYEKAPFDHPSLVVPHGHVGDQTSVAAGNYLATVLGKDEVLSIPAVGRNGSSQSLKSFDENIAGLRIKCANENQTCSIPAGTATTVYYGANAAFISKSGISGSLACNNATFGDPLSGVGKACYFSQPSVKCADENGTCTLPAGKTATVYYGANALFASKSAVSGSVACNNGTFGDPAFGAVKACYYSQ